MGAMKRADDGRRGSLDEYGQRGETAPVAVPPPAGSRLEGWKAIAFHFGRTVRTVQRWERQEGLPVRRQVHDALGSVFAHTDELDRWAAKRESMMAATLVADAERQTRSVSASAHQAYLKAKHHMGPRTGPSLREAVREYRRAIAIEPTWAAAHAGLAVAYVVLTGSEFLAPADGYPRARAAAQHALEIEPELAPALAVLGFVETFFDADWETARRTFERAIASDPRSAVSFYWFGLMLMNLGKFDEATDVIRHAAQLEPLSAAMIANVSRPLICAGDWDGAIDWCRRAIDLEPDFWFVHLFKGFAHDGKGEYAQARDALETSVRLGGSGGVVASLAHACAKAGECEAAVQLLEQLMKDVPYVSPVRMARVATALGNHDEAFQWLERACADRSIRSNCYPHYDYALAPLRRDPRFPAILQHLKLPEGTPY